MKPFLTLACILALSLGGTGPVAAKSLSRIVASAGLTPQDFEMLRDTARQLYDTATPQQGRTLSWTNPDSGSRGTVRLTEVKQNCVSLRHLVYPKGQDQAREILSQRCKDAEGQWILQP